MNNFIQNQKSYSQKGINPKIKRIVYGIKGVVLTLCLVSLAMTAQSQQIQELTSKLAQMSASPDIVVRAEGIHLQSLVYDGHPTLYLEGGQVVKVPVDPAIRVNTDVASLPMVLSVPRNKAEIIIIKIQSPEDLQMHMNLSALAGYQSLKYIYFLCTFDICPGQSAESNCEIQRISRMVNTAGNAGISIIYVVSIAS